MQCEVMESGGKADARGKLVCKVTGRGEGRNSVSRHGGARSGMVSSWAGSLGSAPRPPAVQLASVSGAGRVVWAEVER